MAMTGPVTGRGQIWWTRRSRALYHIAGIAGPSSPAKVVGNIAYPISPASGRSCASRLAPYQQPRWLGPRSGLPDSREAMTLQALIACRPP